MVIKTRSGMNIVTPTDPAISPVRLHHIPNWFRLRLLRAFGCDSGMTAGWYVLQRAIEESEKWLRQMDGYAGREPSVGCYWLDHYGSTTIDGEVCFVSEPYLPFPPDLNRLRVPDHLACSTNCRLLIFRDSAWNPPSTIRLLFKPNY
jgi:hypothetical protein